MSIKNRHANGSKISEAKFRELVRYFTDGLDTTQTALHSGSNLNIVNLYFNAIRERIAEHCELEKIVRLKPLF